MARGHVKALEKLLSVKGINIYNLGTGNGYSVLEMVNTFSKVNGVDVNYKIVERRAGDIACCYADCSKAFNELGWSAELSLDDMVKSAYNFVLKNKK